jgi:hypothetical protein
MIFYFSATGNNKYVASRIAEATGDSIISISECMKKSNYSFSLSESEIRKPENPVKSRLSGFAKVPLITI